MKVKNKYDYDYLAICLKATVVKRFRKLARKYFQPQSETLAAMMDFFDWHGFSPFDQKDRSFVHEVLKNRKRTEAVIAIIKDIEKNHDKPTTAMLQMLFEGVVEKEEPVRKEKLFKDKTKKGKQLEETTVPKVVHERTQLNLDETKKRFRYVLGKVKLINNRFGKDYLKLELSKQEFTRIKRELKKD